MILASLAAATLVATVAIGPIEPDGSVIMSAQQKNAAVQPLVRSATECIARTVLVDPRFHTQESTENLGDLIVASMPSCVTPDNPKQYPEPITAHEYLQERLREIKLI